MILNWSESMKKLYLAVFFSFLFGGSFAKADLHGDFIKVECNKDLGLLTINDNNIWGHDIGLYFEKMQPFYRYTIDTKGADKSHTEIILINNFTWEENKSFKYNCDVSENMSYDVDIKWEKGSSCTDFQDANYIVNVIENKKVNQNIVHKKIIDDVSLGCKGIENIYITYNSANNEADISFDDSISKAYFLNDEYEQPITDERIKQKNKEMTIEDWEVDLRCAFEDLEEFNGIKKEFEGCLIDDSKNELRTAIMLEAYDKAIDCMKAVAYKIFDKYYTNNNKLSKENFENYVNATIKLNNNVIYNSDWAREHRSGEVYIIEAKREIYYMVKDVVNRYIKELRLECNDAYKYDI